MLDKWFIHHYIDNIISKYLVAVVLFIKYAEDVFKGRSFTGFMNVTSRHQSIKVVWTVSRPMIRR